MTYEQDFEVFKRRVMEAIEQRVDSADCKGTIEGLAEHILDLVGLPRKPTKSIRYVAVKLEITHPADIDPDEVINECDYHFVASPHMPGCAISDTEIREINGPEADHSEEG